jgi:hypothetical protein
MTTMSERKSLVKTVGLGWVAVLCVWSCGGNPASPSGGPSSRQELKIDTVNLPPADVGVPYGASLEASGGSRPLTWSIARGALPPGLELTKTGVIAGFPRESGNVLFDVQVTDTSTPPQSASRTLAIPVAAAARPVANISGHWTGTFTWTSVPLAPYAVQPSTTLPSLEPTTQPIQLTLEQKGNAVSGTFSSGHITSAVVSGNRFTGILEWTGFYSGSCPNSGTFTGPVEADHLVWKGSFLAKPGSGFLCDVFLPHDVTFDARRDRD